MKKIIITILCMILTVNAFALKLPNGDNVKADDVVMDGDSIVEVKLKEDAKITTPLNGQQLIADSTIPVKFYKNGALKSFRVKREGDSYYETAIQSIKLMEQEVNISDTIDFYGDIDFDKSRIIEFYESGALKKIYISYKTPLQINIEDSLTPVFHDITFYDSGNPNEFKVYRGCLTENIKINHNDAIFNINSLEWEWPSRITSHHEFYLYKDGKLKQAFLAGGTTIKTKIGEFFAGKGVISFWEDGSIQLFVNDDVIVETIAGMKVSIPSGTKMSIYKSGKIRSFHVNSEIKFKVGTNTYTTIKGNTAFPFIISEDGNILSTPVVSWDNNKDGDISREKIAVESFDSKLEPRIIHYDEYKYVVYNRKRVARFGSEKLVLYNDDYLYYYQPGDTGDDIWMVYFDNNGIPSTYCVYDKKITGERNTEKKQFVRKKK